MYCCYVSICLRIWINSDERQKLIFFCKLFNKTVWLCLIILLLRDRPFNLVFCFVQNFFFGRHELEYLFFLSRIFFPEFNIRLYDKNSQSNYYFFPPPKSEYFFQQHWESEYFFRKKP